MKHTPTPWSCRQTTKRFEEYELIAGKDEIGVMYHSDGMDEPTMFPGKANAELIVKACNSHEALVEALKGMMQIFGRPVDYVTYGDRGKQVVDAAHVALNKAK